MHSECVSRQTSEIPQHGPGASEVAGRGLASLCPVPSSSSLRLPWLQPRARPPPSGEGVQRAWERREGAVEPTWLFSAPGSSLPPSPAQSSFNDPIAGVQQIRRGGSGKGRRRWRGEQEELCTTLFGSERSCFVPPALGSLKGDCVAGTPPPRDATTLPPPQLWPAPCPHAKPQLLSPAWGEFVFREVRCWGQVHVPRRPQLAQPASLLQGAPSGCKVGLGFCFGMGVLKGFLLLQCIFPPSSSSSPDSCFVAQPGRSLWAGWAVGSGYIVCEASWKEGFAEETACVPGR